MILALFVVGFGGLVNGRDLCPQVRSILQDAESWSIHIPAFEDRSVPAAWMGRLYARAGYLDDSRRAFGRTSQTPVALIKASVVYGYIADADRTLDRIRDPDQKGEAEVAVAEVLWRMDETPKAQEYLERARKIAPSVKDLRKRAGLLQAVKLDTEYMTGLAPTHLSPVPSPPVRRQLGEAALPHFPITTDGFGERTTQQRDEQARANAELIEALYTRILAKSQEAVAQMEAKASTPFQKTLVLASVEHLLIQEQQPAAAEKVAMAIPESEEECVLAKAEATSAAAAAWLRTGHTDRANTLFVAASTLARSAPSLPIGEVSVLTTIGEPEAAGGLMATSQDTLKMAQRIASELPLPPTPVAGRKWPLGPTVHYRTEAYEEIFSAAIGAHDLGTARNIGHLWMLAGKGSAEQIVRAWLEADQSDEAVQFARSIPSAPERAKTELVLAQELLDRAGAPNI